MIKPNDIEDIVENKKIKIIEAIPPILDEFLKYNAIKLKEGGYIHFNLANNIENHFRNDDNYHLYSDFYEMKEGRMDIANRLAEIYVLKGWDVTIKNSQDDNTEFFPVLVFSIKKD